MAVWIHCPQCDQHYQFPATAAGKQAACPKCGRILSVSAPAPPAPSLPAAPQAIPIPAVPPPIPAVSQPIPAMPRSIPIPTEAPPAANAQEPLWALPVKRKVRAPVAEKEAEDEPQQQPQKPCEPLPPGGPANTYYHEACGGSTTVSPDIVAWIAGDPYSFISSTLCAKCRRYVSLHGVVWRETGETVAAYRKRLRREMNPLLIALRLVVGPLGIALLAAALGAAVNPKAMDLGALAGVVVGLLIGYFVVGIAFQIGWSISHRKK